MSIAVRMCSNPTRAKKPSAIDIQVLWLTVSRVPASTELIRFSDAVHDSFQVEANNQIIMRGKSHKDTARKIDFMDFSFGFF